MDILPYLAVALTSAALLLWLMKPRIPNFWEPVEAISERQRPISSFDWSPVEREVALARARQANVFIDNIGGWCPVQAEGTIDGHPFYFRSRGERWSLEIQADQPWSMGARYGTWPQAGYMPLDEAVELIIEGARAFRNG